MSIDLRSALETKLDHVTPPPGDIDRVRREGTRLRRRRRTGQVAGGVVLSAAFAVGLTYLVADGIGTSISDNVVEDYDSLGQLDFSEGLRAYADPGGEIHLGGRAFDASDLTYLDTDATATPYGVIFYDDGRPMLLDESGEVSALVEGGVESAPDFHPTAKADSAAPLVAWATLRDGTATLTVHDMEAREDVASLDVECGNDCAELVIDALDGSVVFLRTAAGTSTWQVGEASLTAFAGPEIRVADVRNGVALYDGDLALPASGPARGAWRFVEGPIDAQLTFDGRYVLDWSSTLRPVRPSDEPVHLEVGPRQRGALGFWTIDTDGSVLVAALDGKYPNYLVSDCEVPSGACVDVGPLKPTGGDPMFIGNDM